MVLGPGAFGSAAGLAAHVEGLRHRGLQAEAIDLPRGRAEVAAPRFAAHRGAVIGGHSFGGRAASLAAAAGDHAGLLLFSFPLAGRAAERTRHFPLITCPVLLLSGDRDPLAAADELRRAVRLLPRAELVLLPGAGHSLRGHLDAALDLAAQFVRTLSV